jgi:hypothetical protein
LKCFIRSVDRNSAGAHCVEGVFGCSIKRALLKRISGFQHKATLTGLKITCGWAVVRYQDVSLLITSHLQKFSIVAACEEILVVEVSCAVFIAIWTETAAAL